MTSSGLPAAYTGGVYPTWQRLDQNRYQSVEQHDGIHDFLLLRSTRDRGWWLKWRTSAHWSWYETALEAIEKVAAAVGHTDRPRARLTN